MNQEIQLLEEYNQPNQLEELLEYLRQAYGEQMNNQDDDQNIDIPEIIDENALESLCQNIAFNDEQVSFDSDHHLHYRYNEYREDMIVMEFDNALFSGGYRSANHLYHAIKVHHLGRSDLVHEVRNSDDPYITAHFQPVDNQLYNAWSQIRVNVAYKVNRLKYIQNPDFALELLRTGKALLHPEFTNWIESKNTSGKILMLIREDFRQRLAN